MFLAKKSSSFLQKFSESVAADRQQPFDPDLDPAETMQEWLESKALKNRGLYAARLTSSLVSQNSILPHNHCGFYSLFHIFGILGKTHDFRFCSGSMGSGNMGSTCMSNWFSQRVLSHSYGPGENQELVWFARVSARCFGKLDNTGASTTRVE